MNVYPSKVDWWFAACLVASVMVFSGCAERRALFQIKESKTTVTRLSLAPGSGGIGLVIPIKPKHRIQYSITSTQPVLVNIGTRDRFILNARGTLFEGSTDIPKRITDDNMRFRFSEAKKSTKLVLQIEDMIPDRPYYEKIEKPKRKDGI